jgi:ribonuclease P protein component
MYAYPNGRKLNRFGIVTGKKIGKAVVRNKTKRRIKESIGSFLNEMQQGVDVLFVARPSITTADFAKICSTVENLVGRAGLYRSSC